jgi:hypothetical protein
LEVSVPKGKSAGKSSRLIEQYCSVCKKSFEMPVVEEAENNEVVWLKCPGCKGFLPYMVDTEESEEKLELDAGGDQQDFEDLAIEDIDTESAREYNEANEYKVGETIYHRSWNDYGKVIAKEVLPGYRKTILVHFVNQGKIRLLEGMA